MILTHASSLNEPIIYSGEIPRSLRSVTINGAANMFSESRFGTLVVAEFIRPEFKIRYSNFSMRQKVSLQSNSCHPLIELQFALLNKCKYKQEGIGDVRMDEGQFNILFTSGGQAEFTFEKGHYIFFDIQFAPHYLYQLESYFPIASDFLRRVSNQLPGLLRPSNTLGAGDITGIIYHILHNEYKKEIRALYTEAKVLELLVTAFQRVMGSKVPASIRMRPEEVHKIHEIRAFLEDNMSEDFTLVDVAHKVGLNEFKVKNGFRQLYGLTPFEYLLDCRMEKARKLLSEGNMSLLHVALAIGYKNIAGFTTAFKKKMGYAPGIVKKAGKLTGNNKKD